MKKDQFVLGRWYFPFFSFLIFSSFLLGKPIPKGSQDQKLIILIEGAGDFTALSRALENELKQSPGKIEVQRFHWSHGYLRVLADQTDLTHVSDQGLRLAAMIRKLKLQNPDKEILVLAHSAGCAIALASLSVLNDDMVTRAVMLSPSVGRNHPLVPALAACRYGMHVYYSEEDTFVLGPVVKFSKTADNTRSIEAAGRYGFKPVARDASESALIGQRLKQVKWMPQDSSLGNLGGHYGGYASPYLGKVVLPTLLGEGNIPLVAMPNP